VVDNARKVVKCSACPKTMPLAGGDEEPKDADDRVAEAFSAAGKPRERTSDRVGVTVDPDLIKLGSGAVGGAVWTGPKLVSPGEGLRQRPGDQPLPVSNDWPSAHDEAIKFLRSRKDLGQRRYGSVLQPFNGRDGLLDLQEELADALAYVTRLRQAQAAHRDQLVEVATQALASSHAGGRYLAEAVVDALVEHFPPRPALDREELVGAARKAFSTVTAGDLASAPDRIVDALIEHLSPGGAEPEGPE
jgi:hypothetical protein